MSNELKLSLGQAHELEITLRKAGFEPTDVVRMIQDAEALHDFRAVLRGFAEFKKISHVIDCDAQPFIPEGWEVRPEDQIESRVRGNIVFDPTKIAFHLDGGQKNGGLISGNNLRQRLEGKPVLNACVLDYLFAHKNLLQEVWKADEQGKIQYVYFWGTVYRDSDGSPCIRHMSWDKRVGRWVENYCWLDSGHVGELGLDGIFGRGAPAALLAS